MTQIIAFEARKGGSTKTTLTGNTGAMLAQRGHRVLLIEGDGQGSLTGMVGLEHADSFYDLVINDAEWSEVIRPVPERFAGAPMWVVSASDGQRYLEQTGVQFRGQTLRQIVVDRFAELQGAFDFVLVDTGPGIHDLNEAFIFASHWLVLPTLVKVASFDMLEKMFDYIDASQMLAAQQGVPVAQVLGIQPNIFQPRGNARFYDMGYLDARFKQVARVFPPIQDRVAWAEAAQERQAISAYDSAGSWGRRKVKQAVDELTPLVDAVERTREAVPV